MHDISDVLIMPESINFAFYLQVLERVIERQMARKGITPDPMPELKLYCRTDGGESRNAMAIVNLIRADGNVHGIMTGECISSGATIWAACKRRSVMPYARLGIHPVSWNGCEGVFDHKKLMASAEEFMWIDGQQCRVYAEASNKPFEWWWERYTNTAKLLWFTAEELVEMGMAEIWQEMPG